MKCKCEITHTVNVHLAGDLSQAKEACRVFCLRGLCVTVQPQSFIYTRGEEEGVRVELVNYPRFPKTPDELYQIGMELAKFLMDRLHQRTALVVGTSETSWLTLEEEDND